MTRRLYYADAYLTEFDARVVETADDGRRVYLDRTAFYPTSGGQPHDTGLLAEIPVLDVVDEGDRVAHVLDGRLEDGMVRGRIDRARRLDHMQQHTGQHVLSALFEDLFGYATASVHFGQDASTLDLDVSAIEPAQITAAEQRANEIVLQNRPIGVFFEAADRVAGLRKPPPARAGAVRIVEIPGVDRSACGGTHVRATGQIGPILIRGLERVRKTARLEFVCGLRAVRRARADFEALDAIARSLSCSLPDAPAVVASQAERLAQSERLRRRTAGELQSLRARQIHEETVPDEGGLRRARLHVTGSTGASLDMEDARSLAQAFSRLSRGLLVISFDEPAGLIIAATEDSGVDAAALLRTVLDRFGARGGGSARVAQARLSDRALLDELVAALL